ncbi:protein-glutamate methylesterase/protein-glutamine glutaminase [Megalodesulfovibrio gigas]|uniref:Protein-glutamate methylesterase/protein-glutamine glutaminase n=1 Tax=Megalodesulfovibrio gigas (strain ATCC 19364 / DSM 1382 / NCIMB 9332 / VKM B-1759) TaxID=1121448 RepID=T2GF02_MEGG1|nr:chemotaxis response regulator protein-glutamate methylesterase [Megalodesulfovibrio gigas]AGW15150.1 putative response regulator receiver modulated CheB methylesterase [Megalodesulfovibrio gigas DSM 1382 = ATCC 19364]
MKKKIRVLIVDDSALVRQTLTSILESDPEIEVVGAAQDPFAAAKKMEEVVPDVITLDVEMPRMDGVTFLKKLMTQHPLPVIICSTLAEAGAETTLKALEYGAVDIITKPKLDTRRFLEESRIRLVDAVKAAAAAKIKRLAPSLEVAPKLSADAVIAKAPPSRAMAETTEKCIAVGASTGGTEALKVYLESLPVDCPPVAIVQHMPENFTAAFARRLDSLCAITVKEAADGDTMLRGQALIAPGNKHMLLKRSGARYHVEVRDGPLVKRHRPSVDVLFRSAARYAGKNALGVIMTGMGDDGAQGMLEMFEAGAWTIAQDEASCVVYGMPHEAVKLGGVCQILSLQQIAPLSLKKCKDGWGR